MPRGAGFNDASQEERLISLVHERPVLWDKRNTQHKNSYKLRDAWDEIIDQLHIGKTAVKNKWRSLVKTFKEEVKANGIRTGSAANKNGRKWIHFDSMQFLLDTVTPNLSTGNLDDLFSDVDHEENLSSDSDLLQYKENQDNFDALLKEVNSSMYPNKIVSKTSKADRISLLREALKEKNDEVVIDPSDDMLYFQTLSSYIKMIKPHDRLSLRRDIADLVEKYAYKKHEQEADEPPLVEKKAYTKYEKGADQPQQQKRTSRAARKTKRLQKEDNDSDVEIVSCNIPDDKLKIKKIKEENPFQYYRPNPQLENSFAGYAPIHYPVAPFSLGHFPYAAPDGSQWSSSHHSNTLQLPSQANMPYTVTAPSPRFAEYAPQRSQTLQPQDCVPLRPQFPPPQETTVQQVPVNTTLTMAQITTPEKEKNLNFSAQEESEQNANNEQSVLKST